MSRSEQPCYVLFVRIITKIQCHKHFCFQKLSERYKMHNEPTFKGIKCVFTIWSKKTIILQKFNVQWMYE